MGLAKRCHHRVTVTTVSRPRPSVIMTFLSVIDFRVAATAASRFTLCSFSSCSLHAATAVFKASSARRANPASASFKPAVVCSLCWPAISPPRCWRDNLGSRQVCSLRL